MFNINYLINLMTWSGFLSLLVHSSVVSAEVKVGDRATWTTYIRKTITPESSPVLVPTDEEMNLALSAVPSGWLSRKYHLSLWFMFDQLEDALLSAHKESTLFTILSDDSKIEHKDFFPFLRLERDRRNMGSFLKISFNPEFSPEHFPRFLGTPSLYQDCSRLSSSEKKKSYFYQPGYIPALKPFVHLNQNTSACMVSKQISDQLAVTAVFVEGFNYGPSEIRRFNDVKKWKEELEKADYPDLNVSDADTVLHLEEFVQQ